MVTGGAGFIGSHLVRRLVADHYEVRVLDNFTTGKPANLSGLESVEVVHGDVRSRADLERAMHAVEAVFHLAAIASVERSWSDPVETLAVNAHGTANVIEAAVKSGISAVVYSSSAAVYGDQEVETTSEELEPRPISPYGYSKLLGEKIALAHSQSARGVRVIALRYFNVFGPGQDPDSPYSAAIPIFIKHALAGTTATIYGDGQQSRDFLHVDDVAQANVCAFESDASGLAINIASGQSHTLLQLVDAINTITGRTLSTTFAPPREGDIRHSLADVRLAENAIGFHSKIAFAEGLRRTIRG
ncbi:MAG: NAD-dependent epimerase/dehydratase family protein [Candidatus Dormibacterales bacterium]